MDKESTESQAARLNPTPSFGPSVAPRREIPFKRGRGFCWQAQEEEKNNGTGKGLDSSCLWLENLRIQVGDGTRALGEGKDSLR